MRAILYHMHGEGIFLLTALADVLFVFAASRLGRKWLLGTIAANLILIGIFGSKLVEFYGFITNAGNAFYACVFLATHFLLERQSEGNRLETVWFGVGVMVFFTTLSQFAVGLDPAPAGAAVSSALSTVFAFSPQVVLASMVAYLFAQHLNIWLYETLRAKNRGRHLWLRTNAANIAGQLVDTTIFFTIAFYDMTGYLILQAIVVGCTVKIAVVLLGTPFLYIDRYLRARA